MAHRKNSKSLRYTDAPLVAYRPDGAVPVTGTELQLSDMERVKRCYVILPRRGDENKKR